MNIGRVIYGYCNGFFGDSYSDKRIEAEGVDWIVAREVDYQGKPYFARFEGEWPKQTLIDEWSTKEEREEW